MPQFGQGQGGGSFREMLLLREVLLGYLTAIPWHPYRTVVGLGLVAFEYASCPTPARLVNIHYTFTSLPTALGFP